MKHVFCILTIFLNSFTIFSQSPSDYYVTDSLTSVGIKIVDKGSMINARFCTVQTRDGEITFTPYEVSEYGIGRTQYIAHDVLLNDTLRRVFLEKLTTGDLTLYYYRDRGMKLFFLEDSLGLYAVDLKGHHGERPFRQILKNKTSDYTLSEGNLFRLSFRKQSMREFVKRYNADDQRPMKFLRYGINFGAGSTSLSPSVHASFIDLDNFTFTNNYWVVAGAFLEKPILHSNFSAVISIDVNQISGSYTNTQPLSEIDLLHKSTTVYAPIMARYSIRGKTLSPYINTGACFWYDINNKSTVHRLSKNDNVIFIEPPVDLTLRKNMGVGFVAGAGLDFRITRSNSLFLELRYIRQNVFKNYEINALHFNKTTTQIYAGISF